MKSKLTEFTQYPVHHGSHIIQYDEHVFVWFDEAGIASGVCSYLEHAQEQLSRYAKNL